MVTFIVPWWIIEYTGTESAHIPCSCVTLHPRSCLNRGRMPMGSTLVSSEQAVCSATSPSLGEDKPEEKISWSLWKSKAKQSTVWLYQVKGCFLEESVLPSSEQKYDPGKGRIKWYATLCGEVCFAVFVLTHSCGCLTLCWEKLHREGVLGAGVSLLERIRSFPLGGRITLFVWSLRFWNGWCYVLTCPRWGEPQWLVRICVEVSVSVFLRKVSPWIGRLSRDPNWYVCHTCLAGLVLTPSHASDTIVCWGVPVCRFLHHHWQCLKGPGI